MKKRCKRSIKNERLHFSAKQAFTIMMCSCSCTDADSCRARVHCGKLVAACVSRACVRVKRAWVLARVYTRLNTKQIKVYNKEFVCKYATEIETLRKTNEAHLIETCSSYRYRYNNFFHLAATSSADYELLRASSAAPHAGCCVLRYR